MESSWLMGHHGGYRVGAHVIPLGAGKAVGDTLSVSAMGMGIMV